MKPRRSDAKDEMLKVQKKAKEMLEKRTRRAIHFKEDNEFDGDLERRGRKLRKMSSEESQIEEESNEDGGDSNDEYCWKCGQQKQSGRNGELLCCDSCFRSFHPSCLNYRKLPQGEWHCPPCSQFEHSKCCYCDMDSSKERVVCSKCNGLIHLECVIREVSLEVVLRSPVNKKYINEEQWNQLMGLKQVEEIDQYLRDENIMLLYCCCKCLGLFGVGQIINNIKISHNDEVSHYFLVQLDQSSYLHCHYMPQSQVNNVNTRKLKNYKDKFISSKSDSDDEIANTYADEDIFEYMEPERIIGCCKGSSHHTMSWNQIYQTIDTIEAKHYGSKYNFKFLIKWSRLFYEDSTWEDSYLILNQYREEFKRYLRVKILEECHGTHEYDLKIKQFLKIPLQNTQQSRDKSQSVYITGGVLHGFQLQGLEWLKKSYETHNNVILADEMGLGKTIQSISFLNTLLYEHKLNGPFLVIGPATILYNWLKEFKRWAPTFNVIVYTGNQESREIIRSREFHYQNKNICKFNVLITSYDVAIIDQAQIKKIKWKCLIVDEAHRLKNNDSKFFKVCSQFQCEHIILLTGTPLQNNIYELINLIEFIAPQKAKQLKNQESLSLLFNPNVQAEQLIQISEDDKKNTLAQLNQLLKPHILRRTKTDVNLQVPEMEEIIVKLCLTDTQKFLYKNVVVRNYDKLKVLDQRTKGASKANLLNILMSLRLVCNHPFLFLHKKEFPNSELDDLVSQSNKFRFLDRILPKLMELQHKMLIFSQFTMMLDLLQRYLISRGWSYERLDGNTGIMDRQRIIDQFNSNNSKSRIFLLSTRAGGLGINLTAADTIIFTDSDFNPYRDLQAISRAHRMGQTNKVKVYRLVSKHTAEERIIEIATRKLLLEEIIINPINKFTKDDFSSIFKESTWELFNKNLEEQDEEFTDEQINVLLQRNHDKQVIEGTYNVSLVQNNDINSYYLSGFKFTSLNFETVQPLVEINEEDKQDKLEKYWETLLDGEAKEFAEQQLNEFGKGKRVKKQQVPNYQEEYIYHSSNPSEYSPSNGNQVSDSDDDNQDNSDIKKVDQKVISERMQKIIDKDQQIVKFFQQTVLEGSELHNHKELTEQADLDLVVYGFTAFHRIAFLEFVLKFGLEFETIDGIYQSLNKQPCFMGELRPQHEDFKRYLKEFYAILMDYENQDKNIVFCNVDSREVFYRVIGLVCLKRKYLSYQKRAEKFIIKHDYYQQVKVQSSGDGIVNINNKWTNYDDFCLCKGVVIRGFGELIINDYIQFEGESEEPQYRRMLLKFDHVFGEETMDNDKLLRYAIYLIEQRCLMMMSLLLETEELQ